MLTVWRVAGRQNFRVLCIDPAFGAKGLNLKTNNLTQSRNVQACAPYNIEKLKSPVLPQHKHIQAVFMSSQPQFAEIKAVDYEYVKKLAQKSSDKILIDVREPEELQETGQIPTSINIPLESVSRELSLKENIFKQKYCVEKPLEDSEIIFYCRSGKRSQKAAEMARDLGFRNLRNYQGSWMDWAEHEHLPK